jgi:UDP-N-acetylglucosamine--N-acetylmuramyl-(pentapeptide) pyrophosphoryl-undecaprenol N-acetylglucosamine transferase
MVTGGSQGAQAINAAVSGAATGLRASGVQVLHTLIPVLTDPERIAALSGHASAAGARDMGVVLARYVLSAVAVRRRLTS